MKDTISFLDSTFNIFLVMFIYYKSIHFDNIDEISKNILEEAKERKVGHNAKHSLGYSDLQLVQIVSAIINRFDWLLHILHIYLMPLTFYLWILF